MAINDDSIEDMHDAFVDLVEIAAKELDERELTQMVHNLDFLTRFAFQRKAEIKARKEKRFQAAKEHAAAAHKNLEFLDPEIRQYLVSA